jgi:tetratricopeptide (TPR) repeat protein
VLGAAWHFRGRSRAPLAVALLFLGMLVPALGFVDVFPFVFSYVADHFQYLPSLAILAAAASLIAAAVARLDGPKRTAGHAVAVGLAGVLTALTWRQCQQYRDTQTLFETTLRRNPGCWMCLVNLGTIALNGGDAQTASVHLRQALALKPDTAEAHNDLGNALVELGSLAEAVDHYRQALRLAPNSVLAHSNLGGALAMLGRIEEARAELREALRIMPSYAPARENLRRLEGAPNPPAPAR